MPYTECTALVWEGALISIGRQKIGKPPFRFPHLQPHTEVWYQETVELEVNKRKPWRSKPSLERRFTSCRVNREHGLYMVIVLSHSVVSDSGRPMDCSPPGSSVLGISPPRVLEWVAISSCKESSQTKAWTSVSCTGRQILHHCATREGMHVIELAKNVVKFHSHSVSISTFCA